MKLRQILEEIKYQWWKQKELNREHNKHMRQRNEWWQKKRREADAIYRQKYQSALDPFGLERSSEELSEIMDNPTKKVE